MNPLTVFNNPVCNPAGAALEPTPATNDNPDNMRFAPGTAGYERLDPPTAAADAERRPAHGRPANRSTTPPPAARTTTRALGQDGWAVFGEVTIHFTDTLDLALGVRQHDQNGYTVNQVADPGRDGAEAAATRTSTTSAIRSSARTTSATYTPFEFDKLTSRVALQKQFTDNFMGYVSYSEGFNSGGVSTPTVGSARALILPYKPSTLKNTEIGMRSDLADGLLRFNATVFHTIWADLQATGVVNDPVTGVQIPTTVITNVGEAKAEGVEFELTILPTDNLLINVGLGFLDTAYTRDHAGHDGGPLAAHAGHRVRARAGQELHARLPAHGDWSGGTLDLAARLQLPGPVLAVGAVSCASTATRPSRTASTRAATGASLNLRLTYEPADANWQIVGVRHEPDGRVHDQLRVLPRHLGLRLRHRRPSARAGASLTFRF